MFMRLDIYSRVFRLEVSLLVISPVIESTFPHILSQFFHQKIYFTTILVILRQLRLGVTLSSSEMLSRRWPIILICVFLSSLHLLH
jgi:hypothetical protein